VTDRSKLGPFLKLYRQLIKQRGMSIEQLVNVVDIAANKLPHMESLYTQAKEEVDKMQRTMLQLNNSLHMLNDEIASAKALLNSYHMLCECKREQAANLNNEISRLETVISRFKNNNEEYLKIKKTVEEEVSRFLTDGKVLLQFAIASVIEAIRRNPDKYNNLLVSNTSSSSTSTPAQDLPLSHIEDYRDMILEEANRLYDELLKHFTNSIIDNGVFRIISLPSSPSNLLRLPDPCDTYRKEHRSNISLEINGEQEDFNG
jgi:gas vesicle protein